MNIFASIKKYAGRWTEKGEARNFSAEEIAFVEKAEVVASQYGNSVKFSFIDGTCGFIPLGRDATASVGDVVNMATAKVQTLSKAGEDDIKRIICW